MPTIRTRITDKGVVQENIGDGSTGFGSAPTFSVEVPHVGAAGTVTWAPYADEATAAQKGWYTSWAAAVSALQSLSTPTTILQIEADPWNDDEVIIPGGEWTLNNTTIVGKTTYAHGGQYYNSNNFWGGSIGSNAHRGAQILLQVFTQGYYDDDSVNDNPCRLNGVRGLKDIFWRGEQCAYPSGGGDVIAFNPDTNLVTFRRTGGNLFSTIDAPDAKWIESGESEGRFPSQININGSGASNDGTFDVVEWIDENTVTYINSSASLESGLSWNMDRVNSVFFYNETFGRYGEFVLDNVDFRNGGSGWGSFYSGDSARLFIRLMNGASMRWYSSFVDGRAVVQSDGSPCWVGNYAFAGNGYVKFYIEPGMEFHDDQDVSYDTYNSIIWYKADNYGNWNGYPQSVQAALDELASRVKALE